MNRVGEQRKRQKLAVVLQKEAIGRKVNTYRLQHVLLCLIMPAPSALNGHSSGTDLLSSSRLLFFIWPDGVPL
ncbi:hypothetical protein V6N13_073985 [Hibiscus sabdariffa]